VLFSVRELFEMADIQPLGAWPWAIGNVLIFSGESDD
jgi:hypothetical protein